MRKSGAIKVCGKAYCDYVPCVELRIEQLDAQGLDAGEMRQWLAELREQDDRMAGSEAEWLAAIDKGLALV